MFKQYCSGEKSGCKSVRIEAAVQSLQSGHGQRTGGGDCSEGLEEFCTGVSMVEDCSSWEVD